VTGMAAHAVEERLAHLEGGAVEHERIGALLLNQLVDCGTVTRREDRVAEITQREREQLGDLRRVVDEQDAAQSYAYFLPGPVPGSRGFLAAQGSRSMTQIRPPAV